MKNKKSPGKKLKRVLAQFGASVFFATYFNPIQYTHVIEVFVSKRLHNDKQTELIYTLSKMNQNIKNDTQNNLNRRLRSDQYFMSSSQAAAQKLQLRHTRK